MKGSKVVKKDEVITAWVEARARIHQAASELPLEKQDVKFLGNWGIKDLLTHLVGWDYTYLQSFDDVRAGRLPDFFAHFNPDWRKYNAELVATYKINVYAQILDALIASRDSLLAYLDILPAHDFDFDFGVRAGKSIVTIAWLVQAETHDEEKHAQQIETFLQT
jgi:hypothetical protein